MGGELAIPIPVMGYSSVTQVSEMLRLIVLKARDCCSRNCESVSKTSINFSFGRLKSLDIVVTIDAHLAWSLPRWGVPRKILVVKMMANLGET